jgi:hypothetical protein
MVFTAGTLPDFFVVIPASLKEAEADETKMAVLIHETRSCHPYLFHDNDSATNDRDYKMYVFYVAKNIFNVTKKSKTFLVSQNNSNNF